MRLTSSSSFLNTSLAALSLAAEKCRRRPLSMSVSQTRRTVYVIMSLTVIKANGWQESSQTCCAIIRRLIINRISAHFLVLDLKKLRDKKKKVSLLFSFAFPEILLCVFQEYNRVSLFFADGKEILMKNLCKIYVRSMKKSRGFFALHLLLQLRPKINESPNNATNLLRCSLRLINSECFFFLLLLFPFWLRLCLNNFHVFSRQRLNRNWCDVAVVWVYHQKAEWVERKDEPSEQFFSISYCLFFSQLSEAYRRLHTA